MPKANYSTVSEHPADRDWRTIRAFHHYSWAGTGIDAGTEGGRSGDAVCGVRHVSPPGRLIRQRMAAHSGIDRSRSRGFCDPVPFPVHDYCATWAAVSGGNGQASGTTACFGACADAVQNLSCRALRTRIRPPLGGARWAARI